MVWIKFCLASLACDRGSEFVWRLFGWAWHLGTEPVRVLSWEMRRVWWWKALCDSIICFPMHVQFSPVNLLMNHLLVYFPLSLINLLISSVLMFIIGGCSGGQNTSHWALISFFLFATRKQEGDQQQQSFLIHLFFKLKPTDTLLVSYIVKKETKTIIFISIFFPLHS